ncbi:DUF4435 domain-containing protein [Sphingobacterium sp. 1.A.4]|uniref:DUF4435 domain-containing protein n=1 Tax=Sphingobacterium sp. 1.A.4 TaxID=2044603 RepID=UPI000C0BF71A|nr:DUF4435 domain-containing protein [Sphingobacterium sp. 1.A.4]
MDLLQILDESINRPESSYIKFLTQYSRNNQIRFCFVEGHEDILFYSQFLEKYFNEENLKFINCNGKKNVLDNYNALNWSFYDKKRVLFFIDKDFDEYILAKRTIDSNIYITDHYSIENYLTDENVLKKFIVHHCQIDNDNIITSLVEKFRLTYTKYKEYLRKISSWMIFCRINKYNVVFNNINPSDLFKIDSNGNLIKKKLSNYSNHFEYIRDKIDGDYYNFSEIKFIYTKLASEANDKKYIRGKYDLSFMFMFIKHLVEIQVPIVSSGVSKINRKSTTKIPKPKVTIQIKEENVFQILYSKVKEPDSLVKFINNNLN